MTAPIYTSLYALLLAVLFVYLSSRVIRTRRTARVAVGTGDDAALLRATRVHGNFAEYAPFTLLLIALAELNGAWPVLVHALGLLLLAGRAAHAYGLAPTKDKFGFRVRGMAMTFFALIGAAVTAAIFAVLQLFSG